MQLPYLAESAVISRVIRMYQLGETAQRIVTFSDKPNEALFELSRRHVDTQNPFTIKGVSYPSLEHYIQSQKFALPALTQPHALDLGHEALNEILDVETPAVKNLENYILSAEDIASVGARAQHLCRLLWTENVEIDFQDTWDKLEAAQLEKALRAKFKDIEIYRNALMATEDACIVYDNFDNNDDVLYGWGHMGRGMNVMGKLLMTIRNELFDASADHKRFVIDVDKVYEGVFTLRQTFPQERQPLRAYADMVTRTQPYIWLNDYSAAMRRGDKLHCNALRKCIQMQSSAHMSKVLADKHALMPATELFEPSDLETTILERQFNTVETPVIVAAIDCLHAAHRLYEQDRSDTIAVLNMANQFRMGGGYQHGMGAQEEDLCRRTTLIRQLNPKHYENKKLGFGQANVLYTPNVTVFRRGADEGYAFIPAPFSINVISSAAFNLYRPDAPKENTPEYERGMYQKIFAQLLLAAHQGQTRLVLSAYGCGAFKNDPAFVAGLYKKIIDEHFYGVFEKIVFAIVSNPMQHDRNFETFLYTFNQAPGFDFKPIGQIPRPDCVYDSAVVDEVINLPEQLLVRAIYLAEYKSLSFCFATPELAEAAQSMLIDTYGFARADVKVESSCGYCRFLPGKAHEAPLLYAATIPAKGSQDIVFLGRFIRAQKTDPSFAALFLKLVHSIHAYEAEADKLDSQRFNLLFWQNEKRLKSHKIKGLSILKEALLGGTTVPEALARMYASKYSELLLHGKNAFGLTELFRIKAGDTPINDILARADSTTSLAGMDDPHNVSDSSDEEDDEDRVTIVLPKK